MSILRARLVGADGHECEQTESEDFGIDVREVAAQRAARFELLDAFQDRGWGQADSLGDVDLGLARVRLQESEDLKVSVVECAFGSHNPGIIAEFGGTRRGPFCYWTVSPNIILF